MELYAVVKKETIRKSIGIGASKEKVWQVLFDEKYLPIWYAEFSLGARAQGTWRVGSKVLFTDISGGGLVGKVVEMCIRDSCYVILFFEVLLIEPVGFLNIEFGPGLVHAVEAECLDQFGHGE